MTKQNNLFLGTLDALHKSGVFEDIILIGSWCHHFYRVYFNNAPEIPAARTKYFALWTSPQLIAILPDTLNMSILNLNWNF